MWFNEVSNPSGKLYLTERQLNSPLLKLDLGFPPGLAFEGWISEDILVDHSFVQRNVHRVPEGNHNFNFSGHMTQGIMGKLGLNLLEIQQFYT